MSQAKIVRIPSIAQRWLGFRTGVLSLHHLMNLACTNIFTTVPRNDS